jgi:GNAT superfamily N-acetyltransferase
MQNEGSVEAMIAEYVRDRSKLDMPNFKRENFGRFVRYSPQRSDLGGIICFTNIEEEELDSIVKEQIAHFQKCCKEFEWKVYDFDHPKDLRMQLLDHGFQEGPEETLMIYDLAGGESRSTKKLKDINIERIEDPNRIQDVVCVQNAVWHRSFPWLADQLESSLENADIYCAYADCAPIATGWIDYHPDSRFAEIHGGAVLPEYRGQGVYSLLFEQRMAAARTRGVEYVTVDAAPMSRPILAKKGFIRLCATSPLTITIA